MTSRSNTQGWRFLQFLFYAHNRLRNHAQTIFCGLLRQEVVWNSGAFELQAFVKCSLNQFIWLTQLLLQYCLQFTARLVQFFVQNKIQRSQGSTTLARCRAQAADIIAVYSSRPPQISTRVRLPSHFTQGSWSKILNALVTFKALNFAAGTQRTVPIAVKQ